MRASTLPYNFVFVVAAIRNKNRIQQNLQIMAGGGIAVQIERTGGFKNAMDFSNSQSHTDQIREKAAFLQNGRKSFNQINGLRRETPAVIG